MCGIWAFLTSNPKLDFEMLSSIQSLKERGPDNQMINVDKNYICAFHRLAIHDVSVHGNQPFYDDDDDFNYILMCNGEIYNVHDILKTDSFDMNQKSRSDCSILLPFFMKCKQNFMIFSFFHFI